MPWLNMMLAVSLAVSTNAQKRSYESICSSFILICSASEIPILGGGKGGLCLTFNVDHGTAIAHVLNHMLT